MERYIDPKTLSKEDLKELFEISRDKYIDFMDSLRDIEFALEETDKEFPYLLDDCRYTINQFEDEWRNSMNDVSDDIERLFREDEEELDESLNEALDEPTPQEVAIGVSDVLMNGINKTYDTIREFNSLKINLEEEEYDAIIPVIDSIIEDENNHIGKLQELVNMLGGNSEAIEDGKQETIELVDSDEILTEDVVNNNGYFLSYYEEYPEYEEAEGGYYYACCKLVNSEQYPTYAEAKEALDDMSEDLIEEGYEKVSEYEYRYISRYIGQDKFYIIEEEQGSEEKEPQIYQ